MCSHELVFTHESHWFHGCPWWIFTVEDFDWVNDGCHDALHRDPLCLIIRRKKELQKRHVYIYIHIIIFLWNMSYSLVTKTSSQKKKINFQIIHSLWWPNIAVWMLQCPARAHRRHRKPRRAPFGAAAPAGPWRPWRRRPRRSAVPGSHSRDDPRSTTWADGNLSGNRSGVFLRIFWQIK